MLAIAIDPETRHYQYLAQNMTECSTNAQGGVNLARVWSKAIASCPATSDIVAGSSANSQNTKRSKTNGLRRG